MLEKGSKGGVKKAMKKEKHLYNVRHAEKFLQPNGTVHLPKKFLDHLCIRAGETVVVALYKGDQSVRVRKEKHTHDMLHVKKRLDQTGKVHIPKRFRERLGIVAGSPLLVSLYEGFNEIRVRKERRSRLVDKV